MMTPRQIWWHQHYWWHLQSRGLELQGHRGRDRFSPVCWCLGDGVQYEFRKAPKKSERNLSWITRAFPTRLRAFPLSSPSAPVTTGLCSCSGTSQWFHSRWRAWSIPCKNEALIMLSLVDSVGSDSLEDASGQSLHLWLCAIGPLKMRSLAGCLVKRVDRWIYSEGQTWWAGWLFDSRYFLSVKCGLVHRC
jgi:hypothetical protein